MKGIIINDQVRQCKWALVIDSLIGPFTQAECVYLFGFPCNYVSVMLNM